MAEPIQRGVSRRNLLKTLAAGSAALAGAGAFAATSYRRVSAQEASPEVDVTLRTGGWPYGAMPEGDALNDPVNKAYADALSTWLETNPGVKIEAVEFNVWDQQTALTGLAGGTAPTFLQGNVVGSWDDSGIRAVMAQNLLKDVTEQLESSGLTDQLAEYAQPLWDHWAVNGRYYAAPISFNNGVGFYFRRDLINELGLQEPTPGYTWREVRALMKGLTDANRKGGAFQQWGMENHLTSEGLEILTQVPAPDTSWNWRWDYTTHQDLWVQSVNDMRACIFEDQSVLADITFGDTEILNAFVRGEAAMFTNTVVFYSWTPTAPESIVNLEKQLNKPLEEIVGWIKMPDGTNGFPTRTTPQIDLVAFPPDLNDDETDKAMGLHVYMMGPGFVAQKQALYAETNDLRTVYDYDRITYILRPEAVPGLPGSPAEAWGQKFMDAVADAQSVGIIPRDAWYIPPEEEVGPTDDAWNDMLSRWFYERGEIDVAADLQEVEQTRNSQNEGFTSSVDDDAFREGATQYYNELGTWLQEKSPTFYDGTYKPWMDSVVTPALSS